MSRFLDFYDDASGALLKRNFKTAEEVPEFIKQAHILTDEERDVLRDEAFALVLMDEGKEKKAFPIIDAGNTALSALYFIANKDRMPEEAQKVAAVNIEAACTEFGLPVPMAVKIAAKKDKTDDKPRNGMIRKRDPMDQQQYASNDADWNQRTNMQSIQGTQGAGGLAGPDGTNLKTASVRVVDVTGKEPVQKVKKASSERYALGSRYPLDSLSDVEKANTYFGENYRDMPPEDRREFCVKLASRASEVGVEVSEIVERYSSDNFAPDLEGHIIRRKALTKVAEAIPLYDELWEKVASISPELFAQYLGAVDREAGLNWYYDGPVMDPYFSTFGGDVEKEKKAFWSWISPVGELVNAEQLTQLAKSGRKLMKNHFDGHTVDGFTKDPIAVFESLPLPNKTVIARMAVDFSNDPVIH